MGGCVSDRNTNLKKHKIAFDDEELKTLHLVFQLLLSKDQSNGYLTQKSMLPLFKENSSFCMKLFKWMSARSDNGLIDYDTFVITLELLLKEQVDYYLSDYKYRVFEKFELFALISLGCLENDKDSINRLNVSYSQGSVIIKEMLQMFYFDKEITNAQKNDLAARVVSNTIFEQRTSLPFNVYIGNTKSQMVYANRICKKYFLKKFLDASQQITIPILDQPSFILSDQFVSLLLMSSPQFQNVRNVNKLYSTSVCVDDFEDLAQIVVESKQPLLFVFRNREQTADTFQQQVFGAFINVDPLIEQSSNLYFGDEKSFLFSILPNYQVFMSTFEQNSQRAFAYVNSRGFNHQVPQPFGLGFGGDGRGNFRIWIDEHLKGENINKIDNQCDETYESGFILDPHINTLNITAIEIWSVIINEEHPDQQLQQSQHSMSADNIDQ